MSIYKVVYPLGRSTQISKPITPRLTTLDGLTIGELSNYQFHSSLTFSVIRKALLKRFPNVNVIPYEVFGNIDDPNRESEVVKALPDKLKEYEVDAVITGNGG